MKQPDYVTKFVARWAISQAQPFEWNGQWLEATSIQDPYTPPCDQCKLEESCTIDLMELCELADYVNGELCVFKPKQ